MMHDVTAIFQWIESLHSAVYLLVFLLAVTEAVIGLSMLVPASLTVMVIGAAAAFGGVKIYYIIPLAIIGATIGDNIGYWLGARYGMGIVRKVKFIDSKGIKLAEDFIKKHGAKSVMLGRFVPFIKETIPFVSGMLSMDRRKFMLYNFLGAIGWSAMWPGMGYLFAKSFLAGQSWVGQLQLFIVFVVVSYLAWVLIKEFDLMKDLKIKFLKQFQSRAFPRVLLFIVAMYSVFVFWAVMVIEQEHIVRELDAWGFGAIYSHFNTAIFTFLHIITYSAKWYILLPAVLVFSLFLYRKEYIKVIISVWATLIFAAASVFILKHAVNRPRPHYMRIAEHGASFPSGHATISAAFAGILIFTLLRLKNVKHSYKIISGLLLWVLLIDLSRIYLGVHYLSDIFGGILLGAIAVALGVSFYFWMDYKEQDLKQDNRKVVNKNETEEIKHKSMKIYSTAFENGGVIPSKFTCDGENINPELVFENVPDDAKSLVLIVDDPDVPEQVRSDRHFTHWLLYNLPADTRKIEENSASATQGKNDAGQNAYIGPCPPVQFEPTEHRYFFKLYALDESLNLAEGLTQKELEDAIEGHVIEKAEFYGVYDRAK